MSNMRPGIPPLPRGVMSSRMAVMKNERVETAKTITALERVAVDAQNRVIRARSILEEIGGTWPKALILESVREVQDVLNEGTE